MTSVIDVAEAARERYRRQLACTRIHDLLASHAHAIGDATAAVEGDERLDYAALALRVDAIARGLIAAGVERGDRVATMAPPSLDFWLTYLATVSIGAIWMGLNPRYQIPEYAYLLRDAKPTLVFCRSHYEDRDYLSDLLSVGEGVSTFVALGKPSGRAVSFHEFLESGARVDDAVLMARRAAVGPENIAVIVYTSGTTGKPKGAMLSHRAIMASSHNILWMGDGLASTLNVAPINHVGALNNVCMSTFAYGGKIAFYHRVDIPMIVEIAEREALTYLVAGPTVFAMFAGYSTQWLEKINQFKLLAFGGAATPEATLTQIAQTGIKMHNVYGLTETCGTITATDPGASPKIMADTFGRAVPGADIRIGDAQGHELPVGVPGEIQIRGPQCMSGYFGLPEATAEAFTTDGYLRTGDLGVAREDGNFSYVGRLKEMFKSGGYNIYPVEIEMALGEHPSVAVAAVLPVQHPTFQEVGHAFIETSDANLDGAVLREFLGARLANYKIPKSFSFEPELPRLPNTKVDKQALKARIAARGSA